MTPAQPTSLKKREACQGTSSSSKRPKTAPKTASSRPPPPQSIKRQQSIDNLLRKHMAVPSPPLSFMQSSSDQMSQIDPVIESFSTNASDEPERDFSESESSILGSNATSFMSVDSNDNDVNNERRATDLFGAQFSGGTQMDEEYTESLELQRSFHAAERAAVSRTTKGLLDDLHMNGPFGTAKCLLPPDLPYWYTFELYRISQSLGTTVNGLWRKLTKNQNKHSTRFNEFWQAVKTIYREIKTDGDTLILPAKSDIRDWTLQEDLNHDTKTGDSLSLTARLDFCEKDAKHLFEFKLDSIKSDKSCRLHRQFGADRFLTIDMPYFDRRSLPSIIFKALSARGDLHQLHDSVFRWLTTNDLYIAGRTWRAFYVEPIKSRSKKKRKEEKSRQRLHLFAVNGFDFDQPVRARLKLTQHKPMSLMELIDWHLSLKDNFQSTDMKLFARIQLGLSKTLPTIVLEPHEFISVPDIPAQNEDGTDVTDGTIMTDGCALISHQLARAIWGCHDRPGDDVPSAFQARIGGAKGLWQVDYTNAHPDVSERDYWIEVRDSQLKIEPHPALRTNTDESQRTFEVVKYSTPCDPAHLNVQLINIMNYCGVPRTALGDVLNADLAEYLDSMKKAMHDPLELRIWHQMNHRSRFDSINFCGGMPDSREEELNYLLESGFTPTTSEYLNKCLKNILKQELDSYVDRLRIQVENSTTVFCAPDPLGLLAPGEIQLNFSAHKIDPWSGLPESHLVAPQVLVARNPAHLASDIQLVNAVYHHELRHVKDVIIFPTKGHQPLADLLSGGDYDGDTVTVIWDRKLTEKFQNHKKPRLASKSECGVTSQTRLVHNVFDVKHPTPQQLENFLQTCCSLNGQQSALGEVTVEHEKLIYADPKNLGEPEAERLAALAGYLVDSAKQGDSFSSEAWRALKKEGRERCKVRKEPQLAYKEGATVAPKTMPDGTCVNIIDHLKFDVAKGLRDKVLQEFHDEWGMRRIPADTDLTRVSSIARQRSKDPSCAEKHAVAAVLKDLDHQIQKMHFEWSRRCGTQEDEMPGAQHRNKTARQEFAQVVQELADRMRAIKPLDVDCDIRRDFIREGGGKDTRWSLLKASFLYHKLPGSSMTWKLVGDQLCTMKARAHPCGRTWEMTLVARQIMKADTKRYRRLTEDVENTAEEFYDAEE